MQGVDSEEKNVLGEGDGPDLNDVATVTEEIHTEDAVSVDDNVLVDNEDFNIEDVDTVATKTPTKSARSKAKNVFRRKSKPSPKQGKLPLDVDDAETDIQVDNPEEKDDIIAGDNDEYDVEKVDAIPTKTAISALRSLLTGKSGLFARTPSQKEKKVDDPSNKHDDSAAVDASKKAKKGGTFALKRLLKGKAGLFGGSHSQEDDETPELDDGDDETFKEEEVDEETGHLLEAFDEICLSDFKLFD
uniref:Mevalonate kinase n=1 Tax=Phallusia mammillata TaxID=59560 RepID=A0A6F9DPR2_9ASCI|nr:mevalonate kinase [Phallusia mammillata]